MSHGRCVPPSVIRQESSGLLAARGIVVPVEARAKYARDQMLQGQAPVWELDFLFPVLRDSEHC